MLRAFSPRTAAADGAPRTPETKRRRQAADGAAADTENRAAPDSAGTDCTEVLSPIDDSTFSVRTGSKRPIEIVSTDGPSLVAGAAAVRTVSTASASTRSLHRITSIKPQSAHEKIFNCLVHGPIKLEEACLRIIDTPAFQRLHSLKQLGTSDYVFRGATHTRFEHSIGVAHLAEKVASRLRENQSLLNITAVDVLCVKIAGLCHDLGHGPFSHVFDGVFIKACRKDIHWRHEDGSVMMFRYILQSNRIDLSQYGIGPEDQIFIEEMISGTAPAFRCGRAPNKFFLYDIVNNTKSGLDVDKLDYFERDMKMTNVAGSVTAAGDFNRFIEMGVVLPAEPLEPSRPTFQAGISPISPSSEFEVSSSAHLHGGKELMICYPEKLVDEAVSLFAARFQMHHRVYTHKVVKQVEFMITDALLLADEYIKIPGTKTASNPSGLYKMSQSIDDMDAFSKLNDSILDVIMMACDQPGPEFDNLRKAKELIYKIRVRDLYVCIGQTTFYSGDSVSRMSEADIAEAIVAMHHREVVLSPQRPLKRTLSRHKGGRYSTSSSSQEEALSQATVTDLEPLQLEDIIVEKMHIHYGMKDKNPVDRLRFFRKLHNWNEDDEVVGVKIDEAKYATLLPRCFEERSVRVFCRDPRREAEARRCFKAWCSRMNTHSPFPSSSQMDD